MTLVLNMNGDTQETLVGNLIAACEAHDAMLTALGRVAPHGRNYPNGGYQRAQAQHHIAAQKLEEIRAYLHECAEALSEAMSDIGQQQEMSK